MTVHVHQKDLFLEVWKKAREGKVKDENDFEWLKQTRHLGAGRISLESRGLESMPDPVARLFKR